MPNDCWEETGGLQAVFTMSITCKCHGVDEQMRYRRGQLVLVDTLHRFAVAVWCVVPCPPTGHLHAGPRGGQQCDVSGNALSIRGKKVEELAPA
jgi:hypothetical protein